MSKRTSFLKLLCVAMLLVMGTALPLNTAYAAGPNGNKSCTDFEKIKQKMTGPATTPGILSNITTYVKDTVNGASQSLFKAFTTSNAFKGAVGAALTLMIIFYGVGFLIGVIQASFFEVFKRLIKIGIILTLISPNGWNVFYTYVVTFFNDGTDQLIGKVMQIGTGVPYTAGGSPFLALDNLAQFLLSPDFVIAMIGTITRGGPFSLGMGVLLSFVFGGFLKMLIEGLKLYALSFVIRSLLLGIAPIFFTFMLFDKTRQLFAGWVNMMVALSLQPILYFTFISFFLVMMQTSIEGLLGDNELCYGEFKLLQGATNKHSGWGFVPKGQDFPENDTGDWKGSLMCQIKGGPCKPFPINIVDLLSFLILVYVAQRFADIVEKIANEISNASVNLQSHQKMDIPTSTGSKGGGLNVPTGGQIPRPTGGGGIDESGAFGGVRRSIPGK